MDFFKDKNPKGIVKLNPLPMEFFWDGNPRGIVKPNLFPKTGINKTTFFPKVLPFTFFTLSLPQAAIFFNHLQLVGSGLQPGSWASLLFFKESSFLEGSLTQLPEKTAFKNTTWLDMISKNETYLCCWDASSKKVN